METAGSRPLVTARVMRTLSSSLSSSTRRSFFATSASIFAVSRSRNPAIARCSERGAQGNSRSPSFSEVKCAIVARLQRTLIQSWEAVLQQIHQKADVAGTHRSYSMECVLNNAPMWRVANNSCSPDLAAFANKQVAIVDAIVRVVTRVSIHRRKVCRTNGFPLHVLGLQIRCLTVLRVTSRRLEHLP